MISFFIHYLPITDALEEHDNKCTDKHAHIHAHNYVTV